MENLVKNIDLVIEVLENSDGWSTFICNIVENLDISRDAVSEFKKFMRDCCPRYNPDFKDFTGHSNFIFEPSVNGRELAWWSSGEIEQRILFLKKMKFYAFNR